MRWLGRMYYPITNAVSRESVSRQQRIMCLGGQHHGSSIYTYYLRAVQLSDYSILRAYSPMTVVVWDEQFEQYLIIAQITQVWSGADGPSGPGHPAGTPQDGHAADRTAADG